VLLLEHLSSTLTAADEARKAKAADPDWIPRWQTHTSASEGHHMAERAAIVTGASSGIGLAIARMLGEEGFGLTVASRRPERLETAASELSGAGYDVQQVAGDMGSEDVVKQVVSAHRDRFGRLDVLVNNAGVGIGAAVEQIQTKYLDMQLGVNLRSMILFYRETADLLKAAGADHGNALVVNTASVAGKSGQAWLSVYSAAKHGIVGFTEAMNKELGGEGIKSCALCPGFVDTAMTDFVKGSVPAEEMIRPEDVAAGVRMLLGLSRACVIPELIFLRPGEGL
jgi:NAD(P)-dependent dehydrogenase (short-subunit alcohol dehydrogenase family)